MDHARLQEKVGLLEQQITNDAIIIQNYSVMDSLRSEQFIQYQNQIDMLNREQESLKKALTKSNYYIIGSTVTAAILAIVLLWTIN